MSQKLEFVEKATTPGANVSALCTEYGISRQTGHKWLRRYRTQGYVGLVEKSRRPSSSPLATAEEVVVSIVELRDKHPSWGAQKIARVLTKKLGPTTPSPSTVARVPGPRPRGLFCGPPAARRTGRTARVPGFSKPSEGT